LETLRQNKTQAGNADGASANAQKAVPSAPVKNAQSVIPSVSPAEAAGADRRALDLKAVRLTWAPATLLADRPGKIGPGDDEVNASETVIDGLLTLMQQARRDVLVISPYFVPGARMMAVYEQLRRRGVHVRVLTNSLASNDAPAAHAGYARYREQLIDMGVELYEMRADHDSAGLGSTSSGSAGFGSRPGGSKSSTRSRASLHSKAVIIDGRLAVIGSMNLDLRSQLKNSEMALLIRSTSLASEATRQVETTLATGAYRVEKRNGRLHWRAPAGASFPDANSEPLASARLKFFVRVLGPFAPDEML
jgi:phosphatidylserine/phosphatidylglycerophosphate/cardiolipin synthase-like enzyme